MVPLVEEVAATPAHKPPRRLGQEPFDERPRGKSTCRVISALPARLRTLRVSPSRGSWQHRQWRCCWMRPPPLGRAAGLGWPHLHILSWSTSSRATLSWTRLFAEVHDFIEYSMLVQVFIEFVWWALLKFAIAPGLSGGRGEMAMAAPPCRSFPANCIRYFPCWSLCSDNALSSRPQPLGVAETPLPACPFNFFPPRTVAGRFFYSVSP